MWEEISISTGKREKDGGVDLIAGNRSAGVVPHNGGDDGGDAGAVVAAPEEVVAGGVDEVLVLAGRDGRIDEGLGVMDILVSSSIGKARPDGLFDAEDEEDEEEGGEELERRRLLVPPCQDRVLLQQRRVVLRHQRKPALKLHSKSKSVWLQPGAEEADARIPQKKQQRYAFPLGLLTYHRCHGASYIICLLAKSVNFLPSWFVTLTQL